MEVLSLDLYGDTVVCSAFINLFLAVRTKHAITTATAAAYELERSLLMILKTPFWPGFKSVMVLILPEKICISLKKEREKERVYVY